MAVLGALLLIVAASPAHVGAQTATNLYVSPSGSDSASGLSASTSLRTVQAAIDQAGPGFTIHVGAGHYDTIEVTDKNNLRIIGADGASFSDGRYTKDAGIAISRSSNIEVSGFTIHHTLWGVTVYESNDVSLHHLVVTDIGQEGIHISRYSSDVTIADSSISYTGQRGGQHARYAEGIYLGTGSGLPDDDTHDVRILRNDISHTGSEGIDIKPMVYDVLVEQNHVHDIDTNTSGAIVVGIGVRSYRDPNVVIRGNIIWNISTSTSYSDGTAISLSASATVEANIIWSTEHFGILMDANFVSPERSVDLSYNAVFSTGSAEIMQRSSATPADATLTGNLTDQEVSGAVISGPLTNGQPSSGVVDLRDSLLMSVGAPAPTASPKPTPSPTTVPPPAAVPTTIASSPKGTETSTQPAAEPSASPSTTSQPTASGPTSTSSPQSSDPTSGSTTPGSTTPGSTTSASSTPSSSAPTPTTDQLPAAPPSSTTDRLTDSPTQPPTTALTTSSSQVLDESVAAAQDPTLNQPTDAVQQSDVDEEPPAQLAFGSQPGSLVPVGEHGLMGSTGARVAGLAALIAACITAVGVRARVPHEPLA